MTFRQETKYSCGSSAVRNVVESFGDIVPSEKYVRRICSTTMKGTDEKGLVKGLNKLGYECKEYYTQNEATFKKQLVKILTQGKKAITVIENNAHWIAVTGYANRRITFIDSDFRKAEQHFTLKNFLLISKNIDKIKLQSFYYMIVVLPIKR